MKSLFSNGIAILVFCSLDAPGNFLTIRPPIVVAQPRIPILYIHTICINNCPLFPHPLSHRQTFNMTQPLQLFDPKLYYRFSNVKYKGVTISTGYKQSSSYTSLTAAGSRSSENWQIYRQAGRYIIRNYDYGAELQLGLTTTSPATPQLLPRSGALGQQWLLDQYEDGNWRVTNALYRNASVLGVSDAISSWEIAPAMNPSADGSEKWIITVNLSAGEIKERGMLEDVMNLEVSRRLHKCSRIIGDLEHKSSLLHMHYLLIILF